MPPSISQYGTKPYTSWPGMGIGIGVFVAPFAAEDPSGAGSVPSAAGRDITKANADVTASAARSAATSGRRVM